MSTWMSNYLQSFDVDPADNADTMNNDARDKAQAEKFRQHIQDIDGDPTLILGDGDDLAKLRRDLLPFESFADEDRDAE